MFMLCSFIEKNFYDKIFKIITLMLSMFGMQNNDQVLDNDLEKQKINYNKIEFIDYDNCDEQKINNYKDMLKKRSTQLKDIFRNKLKNEKREIGKSILFGEKTEKILGNDFSLAVGDIVCYKIFCIEIESKTIYAKINNLKDLYLGHERSMRLYDLIVETTIDEAGDKVDTVFEGVYPTDIIKIVN